MFMKLAVILVIFFSFGETKKIFLLMSHKGNLLVAGVNIAKGDEPLDSEFVVTAFSSGKNESLSPFSAFVRNLKNFITKGKAPSGKERCESGSWRLYLKKFDIDENKLGAAVAPHVKLEDVGVTGRIVKNIGVMTNGIHIYLLEVDNLMDSGNHKGGFWIPKKACLHKKHRGQDIMVPMHKNILPYI